jgi:hypothetical protein
VRRGSRPAVNVHNESSRAAAPRVGPVDGPRAGQSHASNHAAKPI